MAEVIDERNDADVCLHTAESVESMSKSLTSTLSMRRGGAFTQKLKSGANVRDQSIFTELDVTDTKALSGQLTEDSLSNTLDLYRQAQKTSQERRKLVIVMVGLPGRGKTYLCNKLVCYLDWCAHGSYALCPAHFVTEHCDHYAANPTFNVTILLI
jgi:signal recognition particle GTPase